MERVDTVKCTDSIRASIQIDKTSLKIFSQDAIDRMNKEACVSKKAVTAI